MGEENSNLAPAPPAPALSFLDLLLQAPCLILPVPSPLPVSSRGSRREHLEEEVVRRDKIQTSLEKKVELTR